LQNAVQGAGNLSERPFNFSIDGASFSGHDPREFERDEIRDPSEVNAPMKAAADGPLTGILAYTEEEVVASGFIGDRHSSIYDAKTGMQLNRRFFKVASWYEEAE
jgi:hypothetical protein